MPDLANLQRMMRQSIHSGDVSDDLAEAIVSDSIPATHRFQVYQNNYRVSLVDALSGIFPVVSAFVGDVFTRAALREFVLATGPKEASLSAYGSGFADFLSQFEHAQDVPYVADIARLEWAINQLQHAKEDDDQGGADDLRFNKNVVVIDSDYPLVNLWMVGTGQMMPEAVHLDHGGQSVAIVLFNGEIQLFPLTEQERELIQRDQPVEIKDSAVPGLKEKSIIL